MMFEGSAIRLQQSELGIAELCFDREDRPVNTLDTSAMEELGWALDALEGVGDVCGLLVTSAKDSFTVGADVTEFLGLISGGGRRLADYLGRVNRNFNRLESLPFPTVVAIDGYGLGGGFELSLSCDYRIVSNRAQVGLPETQLGIIPGWGGTVRLPRVVGVDVAAEWIAGGKQHVADTALRVGAVDAVVAPEMLRAAALHTLQQAIDGKLDYRARRHAKASPLPLNTVEAGLAFGAAKGFIAAQAGPNYPAPMAAVTAMETAWTKDRDGALEIETEHCVQVSQTEAATSLVGIFLNDQAVSRKAKEWEKKTGQPVKRAAVLGAGIMGGGIAHQSASRGVPIRMKDIDQSGLDLGLSEASKLLAKRVERGRMSAAKMGEVLNRIQPTLSYSGFDDVDLVVEAVVENPKVKHAVLAEVETHVGTDTVIASNTSTISITSLAEGLRRPDNFCGMHFFNPVHKMPLVEVIRGEKSSNEAIARTVAYATALGKKAIVVRDCPGFLVNRVLFPYVAGFSGLVRDGADFHQIDKVLERWGWPMGPAHLLDVVGIDTAAHCEAVMADGFPDRMGKAYVSAIDVMVEHQRYGQKNGKGFYDYVPDRKGRPKKTATKEPQQLFRDRCASRKEFSDEEIIARTMVPMGTELARCLEEGIVDSAAEADMALVYGLGFPPFRGGVLRWVDSLGVKAFCRMADQYSDLGLLYSPPQGMRELAATGGSYHGG